MRTGRPKVALILTEDERRRLDSLAHRSRSAPHVARRARIILACADGADSKVVARRLHVTPATVGKWRGRFIRQRLDGLYDEPRPGAVRTVTDDHVEQVIIRTLETTPRGATHWSTRDMAKAVGLSHMAISRIWHTFGLQPHRDETFKLSNDPLLIDMVRDIVGLYRWDLECLLATLSLVVDGRDPFVSRKGRVTLTALHDRLQAVYEAAYGATGT